MNIPMLIISIIFAVFLLWNIPMFAEMCVLYGGMMFMLGLFSDKHDAISTMWTGLLMVLCAYGIIKIKKKYNIY